ncbi:hypothetical protein BXZ70DRAFT_725354 [Cristinia sonorae]|uniref:Uncharacterized protein n=1 Tax=Cristinia sonorae TaxID=1940300 RepID=A0A8K0USY3_9AGAR|nr:hypothetical protein BXZ70DRAFT_725354 [Cristinia sonorae]
MSSRSRVCSTLFWTAYPCICIGVATSIMAFAFLLAAWSSSDGLIRRGSTFLLLIPCSAIPMFLWTQAEILFRATTRWVGDKVLPHRRPSMHRSSSSRDGLLDSVDGSRV